MSAIFSEVGNENLGLGVLGNLVAPQSVSSFTLLVNLEFFKKLEGLFLGITSDLSCNLILHPLISIAILHLLILLSEPEFLQAANFVLNLEVGGSVDGTEFLVSLGTNQSTI